MAATIVRDIPLRDIVVGSNVRLGSVEADPNLVASIATLGVVEPVIVVPDRSEGSFLLVAGHRRVAAAAEAGLETVPAVVRGIGEAELSESDRVTIQTVENIQRKDLTPWEVAQATLVLKDEGLNQGQVAERLSIPKKEVSQYQKVGRLDLDDEAGVQFSLAGLLELADAAKETALPASDIARPLVEGEATNVYQAARRARHEQEVADQYDELAVLQREWAELGVQVFTVNPAEIPGEKDKYGYPKKNGNVVRVDGYDGLGIDLSAHIKEPCHAVWVQEQKGDWARLSWTHFCLDKRRHTKSGLSELKIPETATVGGGMSEEEKASRREKRDAKKLRAAQAVSWLSKLGTNRALLDLAVDKALEVWREDTTRAIVSALIAAGEIGERPTGADWGWYSNQLDTYLNSRFGDDEAKQKAWRVRALHAFDFIEGRFPLQMVRDEIGSITVEEGR